MNSLVKGISYFVVVLCLISGSAGAQKKFTIQKSSITFTSNAELELIKATSSMLVGLLDPSNNQFAFSVPIQSFKGFNSELQRVHFNEKYMESETYPKATFTGKIIEQVDFLADGLYEVRAKGDLDIHGQKQNRIIRGKVTILNNIVTLEASFKIPLSDHNISIPKIVNQKIATEIEVVMNATMVMQ